MSETRTCLACGHEGSDVAMRVVAYDDPIDVWVLVPVTHRDNAIEEPRRVPGVYGAEWRCRDVGACYARLEAQAAPPPTPPTSEEEVPTWLG